ncbi:MAG: hypothetical protein RBR71_11910 [Gudongella sp.]|nr:hypothetical protein [Gudongella sp.]
MNKREFEKSYTEKLNESINKRGFDISLLESIKTSLDRKFDRENGGFGLPPKFPMPQYLLFLLNYYLYKNDQSAKDMLVNTLVQMSRGGIFDQIGYGFFSYSTDREWKIPHYKKKLSDNALLAIVYLKASAVLQSKELRETAEKILEFIIRDLRSEEGGFYTALNEDIEGVEGNHYLFSANEIVNLLGETLGNLYNNFHGLDLDNIEKKRLPNILRYRIEELSEMEKASLNSINQMLLDYRELRANPLRDEKILTSLNGLSIWALSYAGAVLERPFYVNQAKKAYDFVNKNLIIEGQIFSEFVDGKNYKNGLLEDYSFLLVASINLYKATKEEKYLIHAKEFADWILLKLKDKNNKLGLSDLKENELPFELIEFEDEVIPSGGAMAILGFKELSVILGEDYYKKQADELFKSIENRIVESPMVYLYTLIANLWGI